MFVLMSRTLRSHGKRSRDLLHTRSYHKRSMAQLPRRVPFRNPCLSRAATPRALFLSLLPPPSPGGASRELSPCRRQGREEWIASLGSLLFPFSPSFLFLPSPRGPSSAPTPPVISIAKPIPVCLCCENTRTPERNCSLFPRRTPVLLLPSLTKSSSPFCLRISGLSSAAAPPPRLRELRGERVQEGLWEVVGRVSLPLKANSQSTEPGLGKVRGCCLS